MRFLADADMAGSGIHTAQQAQASDDATGLQQSGKYFSWTPRMKNIDQNFTIDKEYTRYSIFGSQATAHAHLVWGANPTVPAAQAHEPLVAFDYTSLPVPPRRITSGLLGCFYLLTRVPGGKGPMPTRPTKGDYRVFMFGTVTLDIFDDAHFRPLMSDPTGTFERWPGAPAFGPQNPYEMLEPMSQAHPMAPHHIFDNPYNRLTPSWLRKIQTEATQTKLLFLIQYEADRQWT